MEEVRGRIVSGCCGGTVKGVIWYAKKSCSACVFTLSLNIEGNGAKLVGLEELEASSFLVSFHMNALFGLFSDLLQVTQLCTFLVLLLFLGQHCINDF